jgi:hypothetical protein
MPEKVQPADPPGALGADKWLSQEASKVHGGIRGEAAQEQTCMKRSRSSSRRPVPRASLKRPLGPGCSSMSMAMRLSFHGRCSPRARLRRRFSS